MSGYEKEIKKSLSFHQEGIPILVSSKLLRSRQMGQIDLAILRIKWGKEVIEVCELKSSLVGVESILIHQKKRLRDSANFLAEVLDRPIILSVAI